VNVFLDSSVLLAACGSAAGAARAVVDAAAEQGWSLLTSGYVLAEVEANVVGSAPVRRTNGCRSGRNSTRFRTC